ncbi:MAG: channel protein TolC [Pseudomonadales bacterium RIFCSPLOWO2_12_59_9]|nr:MAG: channel protein TolC [Pseudomonadales bacterium RIFCSPLOWO2_12_59_9]
MRMPFFALVPLALLISSQTYAQTLPQAMQAALDGHPEIQAGINRRLSADEQLQAAKGGYLPKVDLLAGTGREGTDTPGTRIGGGGHYESLTRSESSLRLRQMVFDGFATSSEVGRQQATVNSRAYALLGDSERTALDVAQVYLDVLKREEMVRLADENLLRHQRVHDQIRLRTERGVGRTADFDQAEARLAQAKNNLITEQTNLADAQVNYFSVVGLDPAELSLPQGFAGQLPANLLEARRAVQENSPLLRSAEADVAATEQQYEAAKSTFYPQVDAELSQSADNNLDGQTGHVNEWQAMLRMRYNLFAGGSDKANLQSKAYQTNEAMDIRNNALRVLSEEMGLAWNALTNAREQLPIASDYVDYNTRVREAYQKQFSLGERSLLDVLDSENELFTSQRRLEEIRFNELFTQYRIKATMGELLKSQGVVPPMAATPSSMVQSKAQLPGLN